MERNLTKVFVSPKAEHSVRGGNVWVFSDEVEKIDGKYENGDIVDILTRNGKYLGSGFINDNSKIRLRIISENANDKFDETFWRRRARYAIDYRKRIMGKDFSACRLIFGEADQFPGLTVDRFENVLVTQVFCLGTDKRKEMIFNAVIDILREYGEKIDVLYQRDEGSLRGKEGLDEGSGFYTYDGLVSDTDGIVEITENDIKYKVDYIHGQKTGFFLDQKYNRRAVSRIAEGMNVLDCFTHTGSFALNCASAGAGSVTAVDISGEAIEMAHENAVLNGLDGKIDFVCDDVFDYLTELYRSGNKKYDLIVLDPPAFTKSRSTAADASRGYKEINLKAMKILPRGGYLATCSCSMFMTEGMFKKMLHDAAADAGVSLRQIEARQQAPDHPILWNMPETEYLKFFVFQVI